MADGGYRDKIRASKLARIVSSAATSVVTSTKIVLNKLDRLEPSLVGGLDTDFYAGVWEPSIAVLNGVQFAFIRAGQGDYIDVQFRNSWARAFEHALLRAPYWYLTKDPSSSIGGQARRFAALWQASGKYDGELPIVVDLEEDINWKQKGTRERVHLHYSDALSFVQSFHDALPSWNGKWIDYTGWSWAMTFGPGGDQSQGHVPLWISNPPPYRSIDVRYHPDLPEPWRTWAKLGKRSDGVPFAGAAFNQISFAGDGPFYGVKEKGIDLDYWQGTLDELMAFSEWSRQ